MATCTLTGSHGRLLMKKNCLSVALLPTPWSPRDTKPVILPIEIWHLKTTYFIEDFTQNGNTHKNSCLGRSTPESPYSSMTFSVGDACWNGRRLCSWSRHKKHRNDAFNKTNSVQDTGILHWFMLVIQIVVKMQIHSRENKPVLVQI